MTPINSRRFPRNGSTLAGAVIALALAVPGPAAPTRELPSPAPADSGGASLAAAPDGATHLTFWGPGTASGERAIWLSTLPAAGGNWTAPRPIHSSTRLMENWADFASLVVGTDGTLWAQGFERREGPDARGYDGWVARSTDAGVTWTPPAPLGHEFVSLAALSGGRIMAVWLESARPPSARPRSATPPAERPRPTGPSMRLTGRLLDSRGVTLRDWVIDPDVCTCCQTTLAPLGGDRLLVAYRGHTPGEIRDNLTAVFDGATWSTPQFLHEDRWLIPACPVNGPAADARGAFVGVAWFTAADNLARVQLKLSSDGGATFGPPLRIDLGKPYGRLDLVAVDDRSVVVSWLEAESAAGEAGLYLRRAFADGTLSAPHLVTPMSGVRASGFPRLAARRGPGLPVVVAWTDAVPEDPANPKSPAATRVRILEVATDVMVPAKSTPPPRITHAAVVRGDDLHLLETCASDAPPEFSAARQAEGG